MAKAKPKILAPLLMLLTFVFAACAIQESRTQAALPYHKRVSDIFSPTQRESLVQVSSITNKFTSQGSLNKVAMKSIPRRMMIGSTAPTCTYNECRGCRFKCRAEQVPVEGNDPINSAYHYRCVCHRPFVFKVKQMSYPRVAVGRTLEEYIYVCLEDTWKWSKLEMGTYMNPKVHMGEVLESKCNLYLHKMAKLSKDTQKLLKHGGPNCSEYKQGVQDPQTFSASMHLHFSHFLLFFLGIFCSLDHYFCMMTLGSQLASYTVF